MKHEQLNGSSSGMEQDFEQDDSFLYAGVQREFDKNESGNLTSGNWLEANKYCLEYYNTTLPMITSLNEVEQMKATMKEKGWSAMWTLRQSITYDSLKWLDGSSVGLYYTGLVFYYTPM